MSELSLVYLSPMLPEIFLAVSAMVLLVCGVFRGNSATPFFCWCGVAIFYVALMLLLGTDWSTHIMFDGLYRLDAYGAYSKMLIFLGAMATLALSAAFLKEEGIMRFEYPVLFVLSVTGMMFMVSAHNFMSLYVGLELQSLCLYILASIHREAIRSAEAGVKYFVLGAISSGMMLFGISMIYGFTGTTDFDVLAEVFRTEETAHIGVIFGMVFILAGIAFKVSAAPFHMWTPDVYEGAPTSVTVFFATVTKLAALIMLSRLLFGVFGGLQAEWQQIVYFMSVSSMVVGAFGALRQTNIKRLMAYSSIVNMGYALIGFVAATDDGVTAVLTYIVIYMITLAGVFGVIMMMRRQGYACENLSDLAGLSKHSPLIAYAMAIFMFSISGIPPFAGFFGKFIIFKAAVDAGFFVLAVVGVLLSVVAAFYYLRIIKIMFFDEPADAFDPDRSFSRRAAILIAVVMIVCFIIMPELIIDSAREATQALFSGA